MKSKILLIVCGMVLLGSLGAPTARADEWNRATLINFGGPVELPGMALSPGTYIFKLLDSPSNRTVVQVYSQDRRMYYGMIMAIANRRLQATDKTVLMFQENRAGSPQALRAWFYPGDLSGLEFVYPTRQAMELAKLNHVDVPSIPDQASPMASGVTVVHP